MTDLRLGLYLFLGIAFVFGVMMGWQTACGKKHLLPLRPWHAILVFTWLVGILAAYPSFMTKHEKMPFIKFPLLVIVITFVVTLVSWFFWHGFFSTFKRATEAHDRRMARY